MIKIDKVLAKSVPEITLVEHTSDCFDRFEKVIVWKEQLIDKVCQKYNLDKNLIIKRLFLTVAFHDIGKANIDFQLKIRGQKHALESHPLASVPFIYHFTKDNPLLEGKEGDFYPETLAVVSHHNKLYETVYSSYKPMKIQYMEDKHFVEFFENLNSYAQKLNIPDWQDLSFDRNIIENVNAYYIFYDNTLEVITDLVSEFAYQRPMLRDVFLLFKSVLHYSDWLASSRTTTYQYFVTEQMQDITQKMTEQLAKKNIQFKKWEDFQLNCANSPKHLFVQIPTGQGKTEASLLWAVNQNQQQKIIYLLPTMVTTNKMWHRMRDFFDDERVALSHGTAQYILKENTEIEADKLRTHYLQNRSFFKAITVATIDQLIYSFFNWGYWVLTGSAAYNAKIIIDEIHIYDGFTLGLLLKTMECIVPFHTQFALMSASLPEIIKDEIEKILPQSSYKIIKETAFDNKQRHILQTEDDLIDGQIENIRKDFNSEKLNKVLIVCNTVRKAREIFDKFEKVPKEQKMLYHSQFILKDKNEKENELDKVKDKEDGFIAVCTQIVEVSLDIDFDVLYTENAPIDAIIQRLGRVNRKSKKDLAKVVVCREDEVAQKYIYDKKILDLTFDFLKEYIKNLEGNLKEKHFKEIVDKVYTKENLPESYFEDIKEGKELITNLWYKTVKDIYTLSAEEKTLQGISSRKIDYITVECVLNKHFQEKNFDEMVENHQYDEIRKYTLKLPLYIAKSKEYFVKKLGKTDIHLLDIEYDETKGVSLKPDDSNFP